MNELPVHPLELVHSAISSVRDLSEILIYLLLILVAVFSVRERQPHAWKYFLAAGLVGLFRETLFPFLTTLMRAASMLVHPDTADLASLAVSTFSLVLLLAMWGSILAGLFQIEGPEAETSP